MAGVSCDPIVSPTPARLTGRERGFACTLHRCLNPKCIGRDPSQDNLEEAPLRRKKGEKESCPTKPRLRGSAGGSATRTRGSRANEYHHVAAHQGSRQLRAPRG